MNSKKWLLGWFILVMVPLISISALVYKIDPYFHYHKPDTENYFYILNNQRSQNDGISKHFDYNALITGTSMTENFKTSEFDKIFGVNSVKVSYSGGSYKEMNDNLMIALKNNPELKTIIRSLDFYMIIQDREQMRTDLGAYPTYLYDSNPFNDVFYLFNKDVIFNRSCNMILAKRTKNEAPGITSFDDYSRWQYHYKFGINTVAPDKISAIPGEKVHLTEDEKDTIYGNITQNVTSLADAYPDVDFYYFFTPYSAVWWKSLVDDGTIYRQSEAEQYAIELILEHPNIHLYSFNNCTDITTDLNNYKDSTHYGQWINSLMLKWMHDGTHLLTKDNYEDYLKEEYSFYTTFDYENLNGQEDYEADFYAGALLNEEITGTKPLSLLKSPDGTFTANNAAKYSYLVFYGKKLTEQAQVSVRMLDAEGDVIKEYNDSPSDPDGKWHLYCLELPDSKANLTFIFNDGYDHPADTSDSECIFRGATLY